MRRLGPLRVGKFNPLSRHKTRHGQHVAEMSISVPLVEGVVLALDRIGEHHECVFRHLFPPSRVLSQRDELTLLAPLRHTLARKPQGMAHCCATAGEDRCLQPRMDATVQSTVTGGCLSDLVTYDAV